MPDYFQQTIEPAAGILLGSSGVPEKVRNDGANQPHYALVFSKDTDNTAFFRLSYLAPTKIGELLSRSLRLRWVHKTAEGGDVQWGISVALIEPGDDFDKALWSEVLVSPTSAGTSGEVTVSEFDLTGAIVGSVPSVSHDIVIKVRRNTSVGGNLAADVYLLQSFVDNTFYSRLELDGYRHRFSEVDVLAKTLLAEEARGRFISANTTAAGGVIAITLPDDFEVDDDGREVAIGRVGASNVTIAVPSGFTAKGFTSPLTLSADGSNKKFRFVFASSEYWLVGA